MSEHLRQLFRKALLCSGVKQAFNHANTCICKSEAFHDLEQGEWCLRRCAELGYERSIRILEEYELTGDLETAFKNWR